MNKSPFFQLRIMGGLRQIDVANQAEINQARISMIENNLVNPRPDEMEKIARVLGVRPNQIWPTAPRPGGLSPDCGREEEE